MASRRPGVQVPSGPLNMTLTSPDINPNPELSPVEETARITQELATRLTKESPATPTSINYQLPPLPRGLAQKLGNTPPGTILEAIANHPPQINAKIGDQTFRIKPEIVIDHPTSRAQEWAEKEISPSDEAKEAFGKELERLIEICRKYLLLPRVKDGWRYHCFRDTWENFILKFLSEASKLSTNNKEDGCHSLDEDFKKWWDKNKYNQNRYFPFQWVWTLAEVNSPQSDNNFALSLLRLSRRALEEIKTFQENHERPPKLIPPPNREDYQQYAQKLDQLTDKLVEAVIEILNTVETGQPVSKERTNQLFPPATT